MRGMSRPYMGPLPGSIRALQGRSVSGLVPAWQTMAANLMEHVKASGRTRWAIEGKAAFGRGSCEGTDR
jgi:hypothetical protein